MIQKGSLFGSVFYISFLKNFGRYLPCLAFYFVSVVIAEYLVAVIDIVTFNALLTNTCGAHYNLSVHCPLSVSLSIRGIRLILSFMNAILIRDNPTRYTIVRRLFAHVSNSPQFHTLVSLAFAGREL